MTHSTFLNDKAEKKVLEFLEKGGESYSNLGAWSTKKEIWYFPLKIPTICLVVWLWVWNVQSTRWYRQLKCSLKSNVNHLDNPNGDATYFNLIKGQCISSLAHLKCFSFWTKQEINLKAYSLISWGQWGRTIFFCFLHLFVAYLHVDHYPPKSPKSFHYEVEQHLSLLMWSYLIILCNTVCGVIKSCLKNC